MQEKQGALQICLVKSMVQCTRVLEYVQEVLVLLLLVEITADANASSGVFVSAVGMYDSYYVRTTTL
jgi:hypothetical protein